MCIRDRSKSLGRKNYWGFLNLTKESIANVICVGNSSSGIKETATFKCPTINILGAQDRMCPVKEGKKLADNIEGSEVEIIENCGHMILLEEASKALNILKKFIRKNHPPKE